jgi:hypothetical protein
VKKTIYGREFIEEIIRIFFFFFFNFLYTKIFQFLTPMDLPLYYTTNNAL